MLCVACLPKEEQDGDNWSDVSVMGSQVNCSAEK